MLFHSPAFLFLFLPITLIGFWLAGRRSGSLALAWLTGTSLFFYGFWNPAFLWLLGLSIIGNFWIGRLLTQGKKHGRLMLAAGIVANLLLLCYFKYANFFLENTLGAPVSLEAIVLPLGISFFTFEQIAWLLEVHGGKLPRTTFLQYCAFITNFPRLIAGPIIRPHELLPQLQDPGMGRLRTENLSVGLTIFLIGLFKKVVLADTLSTFASPVFDASALGTSVTFLEAWSALLAYALQLYFDFSGYTDMAIGTARMFGLILPLNFNAPYRSLSVIDFWRRWHMSLSRFVRDYVYIPLGGSRHGTARRWLNLFLTMVLVGLWHGAGWTFVAWGALHGAYLVINHAWRTLRSHVGFASRSRWWSKSLAWLVTFSSVLVAWVFFRSETMAAAWHFLRSLAGMEGVSLPGSLASRLGFLSPLGIGFDLQEHLIMTPSQWAVGAKWVFLGLAIALVLPTTQRFMRGFRPALDAEVGGSGPCWQPTKRWALGLAALTGVTIVFLMLSQQSEFLYFQF